MPSSTSAAGRHPAPEYLRHDAVAAMLDVSPYTLRAWVRAGKFPRPIRVGGSVRFPLAAVREHLDKLREEAADER